MCSTPNINGLYFTDKKYISSVTKQNYCGFGFPMARRRILVTSEIFPNPLANLVPRLFPLPEERGKSLGTRLPVGLSGADLLNAVYFRRSSVYSWINQRLDGRAKPRHVLKNVYRPRLATVYQVVFYTSKKTSFKKSTLNSRSGVGFSMALRGGGGVGGFRFQRSLPQSSFGSSTDLQKGFRKQSSPLEVASGPNGSAKSSNRSFFRRAISVAFSDPSM